MDAVTSNMLPRMFDQPLTLPDNEVNRYNVKTYIKSLGLIGDTRGYKVRKSDSDHFKVTRIK